PIRGRTTRSPIRPSGGSSTAGEATPCRRRATTALCADAAQSARPGGSASPGVTGARHLGDGGLAGRLLLAGRLRDVLLGRPEGGDRHGLADAGAARALLLPAVPAGPGAAGDRRA